jgi:nucleoside-diphosphate-sugar epimerase
MKAAVLGRPFDVRWGGRSDFIFAEDVARAILAAAASSLDGARVYNLHGESVAVAHVVRMIEEAWPSAKGTISHARDPIPFPEALADHAFQRDLGPRPRTSFREGLGRTLEAFAALQKAGRLDARELAA